MPNFVLDADPIRFLTAWVRIPRLPVEYFDTAFLKKIGDKIGRIVRADNTTACVERRQFTRFSVELDLTKPMLSKFRLKGRTWGIQYEGLKLICFKCGKSGHREAECNLFHAANRGTGMITLTLQERILKPLKGR